MKFFLSVLVLALASWPAPSQAVIQGISQPIYDRFVKLATICMSPYLGDLCVSPGGLTKVSDITNTDTDTNGWVLRDDPNQELLVVWKGTDGLQNYETDLNWTLANFDTQPACVGCQIHGGYYVQWASIYQQVQSLLQDQVDQYPDYQIIITGHSLGGALASLTAAQFATTWPDMTVVTFGQPRTGNAAYAAYVDGLYTTQSPDTTRLFRATHEDDGVVNTGVPISAGYEHHGLEYWNRDPTAPNNTFICAEDEEQLCCEGQGGDMINQAHLTYFGETVVIDSSCF